MNTKIGLKEFLKQPAGKQLIIAFVIAISTLSSIVGVLYYTNAQLQADNRRIEIEKGDLKEKCGEEKLLMAQKYDREMKEALQRQLAEMKEKEMEREKRIDEVIREANRTISTQAKAKQTLKKINKTVNKIIKNES